MKANNKIQAWLPFLLSLTIVIGMLAGYYLQGNKKNGLFGTNKTSVLQEALTLIKLKYVDKVETDTLQQRAIEDIMNELDPHSVFLSKDALKQANEDLAGNFQGIGVEFNLLSDTVTVLYVIPEGPSKKAGIKIGDKLISANDSSLIIKENSTERIKSLIRGPIGSKVKLGIVRDGKVISVTVTRGNIPVPAVESAYMLNDSTGYIKLVRFSETSYEEFMRSLETLQKNKLKSLVLDLRGNGGGFMNEAVDIADEFLSNDKLIVYTQGENSKKREYRCKRPGLFEQGKLVLLVDELSASASEVLAGALQDWCRADIIGRRTFGKGLVQEQYVLDDGSAIRLTVARYYTPLGRSIQRSYQKGKKVYMDEIWERYSNGEMVSEDSMKAHNGKSFYTNCNDTLYDGGGISPRYFVPYDTNAYSLGAGLLLTSSSYSEFIYGFYKKNESLINSFKTPAELYKNTTLSSQMNTDWIAFTQKLKGDASVSLKNKKDSTTYRLIASLARFRWGNAGYYETLNTKDPMIFKALAIIK